MMQELKEWMELPEIQTGSLKSARELCPIGGIHLKHNYNSRDEARWLGQIRPAHGRITKKKSIQSHLDILAECTSTDPKRHVLMHVHYDARGYLEATDGRQLVRTKWDLNPPKNALMYPDEHLDMYINGEWLSSRNVGRYNNVDSVIPKNCKEAGDHSLREWLHTALACQRLNHILGDKTKDWVKVRFKDAYFNPHLLSIPLMACWRLCQTNRMAIKYCDEKSPLTIEHGDTIALVMPIMVKNHIVTHALLK